MRDWAKWRKDKARRSANASKAATARWKACHAACSGEPLRESRKTELTIRDTHRPLQIVRIERQEIKRGWSRGRVEVNGQRVGRRTFGRTAIARLIAEALA